MLKYEAYEINTFKSIRKENTAFLNNAEKSVFKTKKSYHTDKTYQEYKKLNLKGYTYKSYIRGDSLVITDKVNLIENKNYSFIFDMLRPSKRIDRTKFIKTVDSNLKAMFSNDLFNYLKNYNKVKKILLNTNKKNLLNKEMSIDMGKIKMKDFNSILVFFEYGLFSLHQKVGEKIYITKSYNSHNLFTLNLKSRGEVKVQFNVDFNGKSYYSYLSFYYKDELIYELSTRKNGSANSAFINVNLLNHTSCSSLKSIAKKVKEITCNS